MHSSLAIEPSGRALGATVRGLDLAEPLAAGAGAAVRAALVEHEVLFFPEHDITPGQHVAFGSIFGPLQTHKAHRGLTEQPEIAVLDSRQLPSHEVPWHTDVSCSPMPPMGSILQLTIVPPHGGATHWASMTAAYAALPAGMRERLAQLTAVHRSWWTPVEESIHPVVVAHPDKPAPALFVNSIFTKRICELDETESDDLLEHLFAHADGGEFTVRHDWRPGDVAFWDNRCTQHRVDNDYGDAHRRGQRVTIDGLEPVAFA